MFARLASCLGGRGRIRFDRLQVLRRGSVAAQDEVERHVELAAVLDDPAAAHPVGFALPVGDAGVDQAVEGEVHPVVPLVEPFDVSAGEGDPAAALLHEPDDPPRGDFRFRVVEGLEEVDRGVDVPGLDRTAAFVGDEQFRQP